MIETSFGARLASCTLFVLALAGCGQQGSGATNPSAASASAAARQGQVSAQGSASNAGGQVSYESLQAAAKSEGKINIITAPGDGHRQVFDTFQKTFGVTPELLIGNGSDDIVPRVVREQESNQFLWDVAVISPVVLWQGLKPAGALEPLVPAIVRDDVKDDSKWAHGFAGGWIDKDKSQVYSFVKVLQRTVYVNRAIVPEEQFNSLDQLWDPRWKGKIAMQDPTVPSAGSGIIGAFLRAKGEDKLRSFLRDQSPVLTRDRRQLAEWFVRGQYPIALGVDRVIMTDFKDQGIDLSQLKTLTDDDPASVKVSDGTGSLAIIKKGAHPNAGKLLVNWLLTQEGQSAFARLTGQNVRRLDAPVIDAASYPDPKIDYLDLNTEADNPLEAQAIQIAKATLAK